MSSLLLLAQISAGAVWAGSRPRGIDELEMLGLVTERYSAGGYVWRTTERGEQVLEHAVATIRVVRLALRVGPMVARQEAA